VAQVAAATATATPAAATTTTTAATSPNHRLVGQHYNSNNECSSGSCRTATGGWPAAATGGTIRWQREWSSAFNCPGADAAGPSDHRQFKSGEYD